MKKYSVGYFKALNIIYYDLNLTSKPIINNYIKKEYVEKVITYKSREFNLKDLEYLNQFNIDLEILKFYNVKALDYYYINKTYFKADNQTYIYPEIYKGKYVYKIYMPNKKDIKFLSNDGNAIYGIHQLPKEGGDILFITSSKKDIMSLKSLGFYSISGNCESVNFSKELFEYLKLKWKYIYFFYDYDEQGKKSSIMLNNIYNTNGCLFTKDKEAKDPSDYIKEYSKDKLLNLINSFIYGNN